MKESFGHEGMPAAVAHETPDLGGLEALQMGENEAFAAPAVIEGPNIQQALESVDHSFEQKLTVPIEQTEGQVNATEKSINEVRDSSAQLQQLLPEASSSGDRAKFEQLTRQLNDLDSRRITLLGQQVFLDRELAFQKRETQQFARERNKIVEQLIMLLREILTEAKKEFERLQSRVSVTRTQLEFSREEQLHVVASLDTFELQIKELAQEGAASSQYQADIEAALGDIAMARNDIESQKLIEEQVVGESESAMLLIEADVKKYQGELEQLEGSYEPLMIEDKSDEALPIAKNEGSQYVGVQEGVVDAEFEEVDILSEEPPRLAVDVESPTEDIVDAEFESDPVDALPNSPRVNTSMEAI